MPKNTPSNSYFLSLGKTGRKVLPTFSSNFLSAAPQSFLFLVKEMEKSLLPVHGGTDVALFFMY